MIAAGLVDEVRALASPGRLGPTAADLIGVKELLPALRTEIATGVRDEAAIAAAIAGVWRHTWVLARRQATWWKAFAGVLWLDVRAEDVAEYTGERVAEVFLARA